MSRAEAAQDGLLIINADDFGYDSHTTDAIAQCIRADVVTSTTAMTFMADSSRAASIASADDFAVGLHINLSEPLTATEVPAAVRERHTAVVRQFRTHRRRRLRNWIYDPRIRTLVDDVIADQRHEFERLFDRPPTHVDGHKHVQVCLNVAFSRAIPAGTKTRAGMFLYPPRRTIAGFARGIRHRVIATRLDPVRFFFPLPVVHPGLGGEGLETAMSLARENPVEIMVHPAVEEERALLLSEEWRRHISGVRTGSFADFGAVRT